MFTIQNLATILSIIIIAGYLAWKEIREYQKRKNYSLAANPDRCQDHELRLREIERSCGQIKTDVAVIVEKVGNIEDRMDNIGEVFAAAGSIKP
jgi:hypothetical protein